MFVRTIPYLPDEAISYRSPQPRLALQPQAPTEPTAYRKGLIKRAVPYVCTAPVCSRDLSSCAGSVRRSFRASRPGGPQPPVAISTGAAVLHAPALLCRNTKTRRRMEGCRRYANVQHEDGGRCRVSLEGGFLLTFWKSWANGDVLCDGSTACVPRATASSSWPVRYLAGISDWSPESPSVSLRPGYNLSLLS